MLVTDLAAEWQRAVNPDDAPSFASRHGGIDGVFRDPGLRAGYQRREQITKDFLSLMRQEYQRRKLKAPFDEAGAVTMTAPKASSRQLPIGGGVSVVHPNADAARQWYRFRGPTGQGTVEGAAIPLHWGPASNICWKTELPGRGNSSPVIWGDRIFLTCADEKGVSRSVVCADRTTGGIAWERRFDVAVLERMVRDKNGFASSTPAVDGERVYVFLGNAGVICLDFEGNQKWQADLGRFDGTWGPGASPILYRGLVILNQDQSKPSSSFCVALDRDTGRVIWRSDRAASMGWCTPMVFAIKGAGRDEMIFASAEMLFAVDPATGRALWNCGGPTREPIPAVVTGNGLIYCTSGRNGPTLAVRPGGSGDVTDSMLVWSALRNGPHVPSPALVGHRLLLVNDHGILTCLDALTGATLHQRRLGGKFSSSPIVSGDLVYFTNEDGVTTVIRAEGSFEAVAENELGEPVLASFAAADGRLFIRSPKTLYCIGAPR